MYGMLLMTVPAIDACLPESSALSASHSGWAGPLSGAGSQNSLAWMDLRSGSRRGNILDSAIGTNLEEQISAWRMAYRSGCLRLTPMAPHREPRTLTTVSDLEECLWPVDFAQKGQTYLSPPYTNGTGGGVLAGYGSHGGEREAISAPKRVADPHGADNRLTYVQPMLMSIEQINNLLLEFDDGFDSGLPSFASGSGQSSSMEDERSVTDSSSLGDPSEQLSNL